MYDFLPYLAEFSSLIVAILIHVFLWGLVLYIIKYGVMVWIHGEHILIGDNTNSANQRIPQMKMMKVHIPFTFKLQDNANFSSGTENTEIGCKISSQMCYRFFAYWGVSIKELHLFLWRPWLAILSSIDQGTMLEGHYQHAGTHFTSEMHADKVMHVKLPDVPLDLGSPPRLYYPLVVFLITDNTGDIHPDETVALINIVHIKDMVCTFPTSILAQYLKQANGQLSCLKQLYMAASSPMSYDSGMEVDGVDQLCVVCQHFPLSRALLPCRHTCICGVCFGKLDTCPMCRSPIRSYFCIRNEEYLADQERTRPTISNFQVFANWLNNRLGLHQ